MWSAFSKLKSDSRKCIAPMSSQGTPVACATRSYRAWFALILFAAPSIQPLYFCSVSVDFIIFFISATSLDIPLRFIPPFHSRNGLRYTEKLSPAERSVSTTPPFPLADSIVLYFPHPRLAVIIAIWGLGWLMIRKSPSLPHAISSVQSDFFSLCDIPAKPIAVVSDPGGRQPVSMSEFTTSCEQSIGSHGTSLRPSHPIL